MLMFNDTVSKKQYSNYVNEKMSNRNVKYTHDKQQPYIGLQPTSTKYQSIPGYTIRNGEPAVPFFTSNTKTPCWYNYINNESLLRNQTTPLSKSSKQTYIPNSDSDLYYYNFKNSENAINPHSIIQKEEVFEGFNPNPNNLGYQLFHNNTRVQLKQQTPKK